MFLAAALPLTREVPAGERDKDGLAAANAVSETDILKAVTGVRDFGAARAEGSKAPKPDTDVTPTQTEQTDGSESPTYTQDTIPQVTGLTRLSEKPDSIKIAWDDVPGIRGYRIYRRDDNDSQADYRLFSAVRSAGLEMRRLAQGSKYSFKIVPYIIDGEAVCEGEAAEVTFGTVPTDVEGFRMIAASKDTVSLAWSKNERADGYLVERSDGGEWSALQDFDADTTDFTDDGLDPGGVYSYRIRAYRDDTTGRMPGAASELTVVAGLLGPEDSGSASKLGRVSLDYKTSDYADGYKIYYATDQKSWEQLTDTEKTHYSTSRLEDGVTYYFRIYPYKNVGDQKIIGIFTQLEFVAQKEIYDKTVGDTYVEVSLSDQHMWYIVDGDVYLESDCVTGNYGSADTPKGYFEVNNKMSPCTLKGDDYTSYVTYWMPFIGGGWGLHDATWRSKFGGNIYKGDGSHGCVNLPYDIAKQMYAHIEIGTPVIVY